MRKVRVDHWNQLDRNLMFRLVKRFSTPTFYYFKGSQENEGGVVPSIKQTGAALFIRNLYCTLEIWRHSQECIMKPPTVNCLSGCRIDNTAAAPHLKLVTANTRFLEASFIIRSNIILLIITIIILKSYQWAVRRIHGLQMSHNL